MINLLAPAVSRCLECKGEPVLPLEDCRCCDECTHHVIRLVGVRR